MQILSNNDIEVSYSKKGYPYHNAWIESFHGSYKRECIYNKLAYKIEDAFTATFEYIEGFYNNKRIHESLNYLTPNQFEKKLQNGEVKKQNCKYENCGLINTDGYISSFKNNSLNSGPLY